MVGWLGCVEFVCVHASRRRLELYGMEWRCVCITPLKFTSFSVLVFKTRERNAFIMANTFHTATDTYPRTYALDSYGVTISLHSYLARMGFLTSVWYSASVLVEVRSREVTRGRARWRLISLGVGGGFAVVGGGTYILAGLGWGEFRLACVGTRVEYVVRCRP